MSVSALDRLDDASSDKELFDAASSIVSIPKEPGAEFWESSFILHAPLEISARYFLLPLVEDEYVAGARKQIRITAKKYFELENVSGHNDASPANDFDISRINIDLWSTSLSFASHAPILLGLQSILGETNDSIEQVLMRMNVGITGLEDTQMAWTRKPPPTGEISPELIQHPGDWFIEHVGNVTHVGGGDGPIREGVERAESAGVVEPLIEILGSIANFSERATFDIPFQSLARTCALSMIVESDTHAKYGWTHCLTIPHAMWILSSQAQNSARLLQAATTHAATFRAILGEEKLDANILVEYFEPDEDAVFAEHHVRILDIISQAATMVDAHLVKYVYSCFDLMKRDPHYSKLYITAAGKLLDIWQSEQR